jgi:hypothetical protein
MEHRAEPAIQVYRGRRVFNRVGHRPQLLPVGKSGVHDHKHRETEQECDQRRVDYFQANERRFGRITTEPSWF